MEIIEIKSHKELPRGVEMNFFEPPYRGDEVEEVVMQFRTKYGKEPETIYRLDNRYWVVK